MKKEYKAWAIDTGSDEHGLIGKFWWFEAVYPNVPIHMRGYQKAMFPTRQAARDNLRAVKRAFPKARVVRVNITINCTG